MTVGWTLPRDWDAGRLLRFVTGLALLALAFAANAGLIATPAGPAPSAPAVSTTVDIPAASAADQAPASEPVPARPAPAARPVLILSVIGISISAVEPTVQPDPAGAGPGSHGSRAPPAV